jgi:DNA-binding transcriptional LysR family regulator
MLWTCCCSTGSSRQAQLTAAGEELLNEGRRLLAEMDAVARRVRRVSTGWETELTIAVDGVLSRLTLLELCEAFYALRPGGAGEPGPGTRLRLRTEVLVGTWEALVSGHADLVMGVPADMPAPPGIELKPLGEMCFAFVVAPHHPLAQGCRSLCLSDAQILRPPGGGGG